MPISSFAALAATLLWFACQPWFRHLPWPARALIAFAAVAVTIAADRAFARAKGDR